MHVLIINGKKMNSFALSIEAVYFFTSRNYCVTYLDLNTFDFKFSTKKHFLRSTLETLKVSVGNRKISEKYGDYWKAVKTAVVWYRAAKISLDPWNFKESENDLPIGRVIKSLIARTMGSSHFELHECSPIQVLEIASKVSFSYLQTLRSISTSKFPIELGIAHGGRDAYSAGSILAFRDHEIPIKLLESGGVSTNWSLFDKSPHYSPDFWLRLKSTNEFEEMESISKWWESRIKGSDHFRSEEWAHTRIEGLLPKDLPNDFISFFTTSDFEIPVFEDFDIFPGKYKNQIEALRDLVTVTERKNIHLVIRRHPNSLSSDGTDKECEIWQEFQDIPHVTYIGPKEKIDSISLARMSKAVFTFKSSVGIESIWLGTPAFAMGPARWAWTDELRTWDLATLEKTLCVDSIVNKNHSIRWATMMMKMDFPCIIFNEIHGNFAKIQDLVIKNSKFGGRLENLIFLIASKFVH